MVKFRRPTVTTYNMKLSPKAEVVQQMQQPSCKPSSTKEINLLI